MNKEFLGIRIKAWLCALVILALIIGFVISAIFVRIVFIIGALVFLLFVFAFFINEIM